MPQLSAHQKTKKTQIFQSDLVIIGGGLAGLYTALQLAPLSVTVVMSAPLGEGTASSLAQGGIAAAMGADDSPQSHCQDTKKAGGSLVDEKIACLTTSEAKKHIETLLDYGVPFDLDGKGRLKLTREAAHSQKRIVHVLGDSAGKAIMAALVDKVHQTPSIRIVDNAVAKKFETTGSKVTGVWLWSNNQADDVSANAKILLKTKAVILATGGVGGLFSKTTNPLGANGEALAMAARAGAVIADAEFVQFHPTAIDAGKDPVPLATEALRGEGAHLVNKAGTRFMQEVHEDAELAPRDIVARAVFKEIQEERGAFLDCRTTIPEFAHHFPSVYHHCQEMGIDPASDLIPIAPAVHYHMGGVFTDAFGRTTLNGLWACGEAASTGLHGANRLASNSLLEAMVFAGRVAEDVKSLYEGQYIVNAIIPREQLSQTGDNANDNMADMRKHHQSQHHEVREEIRNIMYQSAGLLRKGDDLAKAIRALDEIARKHPDNVTLLNMVCAGQFILVGAWQRQESRGGHFRLDYPEAQLRFAKHTYLTFKQVKTLVDEILQKGIAQNELSSGETTLRLVVNK